MSKKLTYEQSSYKADNNLCLWKELQDENYEIIYEEVNYSNEIKIWI